MTGYGALTIPLELDHIVIAGPSLSDAVRAVESWTGVRAVPGGQHPGGTANALIALSVGAHRRPLYLEIVGPARSGEVPPHQINTFGISSLAQPTAVAYAVHPDDIETRAANAAAAGWELGGIREGSRHTTDGATLRWRMTPMPEAVPMVVPFLIDWGRTSHPGTGDLPLLDLRSITVRHPEPGRVRLALDAIGVAVQVSVGNEPAIVIEVAGPIGVTRIG